MLVENLFSLKKKFWLSLVELIARTEKKLLQKQT